MMLLLSRLLGLDSYRAKWERERLENFTLRNALKDANREIRTLRQTIVQLKLRANP